LGAGRQIIETTELGHHEPGGKIRLSLRARFLGDTSFGARGHGGPIGLNPAAKLFIDTIRAAGTAIGNPVTVMTARESSNANLTN
jgi:hypothetical protein